MQHSDCTPRIPTVTAEEAVKMSWLWSSSQTLKEVSRLITALWNAGRVQGIREERARRKRKAQTIEQ